jgi:hypothetical protein
MARQSYKWVYGKTDADIMVSEGIAPASYFLPDDSLPDLWTHSYEDQRYKVLIPKGTILTLTETGSGDYEKYPPAGLGVPVFRPCTTATNPVGIAQYHFFRSFDKGTSQGAGWIRRGYIKYPYIPDILTPGEGSPAPENASISPSDYVMSDALGRFTKWVEWDSSQENGYSPTKIVGQVIDIQKFGVNYDTQLMEYMTYKTEDFNGDLNAIKSDGTDDTRPPLATDDYEAMFETGVDSNPYEGYTGVDDILDRYGAQGMITVALML